MADDPADLNAGQRYRRCREAFADLIRSVRPDELAVALPTCPGWSVHDVVAHLAGVAADAVNGVTPGDDQHAWTAAQVDARRGQSTSVVLREWERTASQLEVLLAKNEMRYPASTLDILCHEQDVRGALGRPGRRDGEDLLAVVDMLGQRLDQLVDSAAIAPLAVVTPDGHRIAGPDGATVTLEAGHFEFFRASFGRRSLGQLTRRLHGTDEPDRYVSLISIFPTPESDILE